jgi:hypothetical protein
VVHAADDSTARKRSWIRDKVDEALQGIHKNPCDTFEFIASRTERSEDVFKPFEGKIIRYITVVQFGFDRQLFDTGTRIGSLATAVASQLHVNTKEWVLRNHLFIREKVALDPYVVADNERFLRTLPFIQDVRILPARVGTDTVESDSVDLVVVAKDFFTLSGDAEVSGFERIRVRGYDANFLGMGQRLQLSVLYDMNRRPVGGFDAVFSRSSLGGTFVNGTVGYSTINSGRSDGNEEETAMFARLDRPLVSPNALVAGGIELSRNWSRNVGRKPDSMFYDYKYDIADVWGGINLNTKAGAIAKNVIRDRKFVALRYLQSEFIHKPGQIGDRFDPIYNNRQALLASMTFFRLDYFKTHYIYGFGVTEDVPHGYNASITTGWYRQNGADRPYAGLDIVRYTTTSHGKFCQTFLKGGAFRRNGGWEDVGVLIGGTMFTQVFDYGYMKLRHQLSGSAGALFNRTGLAPLRINNNLGLSDFTTDSLYASQRFSLGTETVIFMPAKPFGFHLAPFVFANVTLLNPGPQEWHKADGYTGLGGGVRARNENLIFGTIELRATYFPRTAFGVAPFRMNLSTNLRYRYRTNYVQAPEVFRLNEEIL